MDSGLSHLGDEADNPFRQLAQDGRAASAVLQDGGKAQQLGQRIDASDWIASALHNSLDAASARQQAGLAILASIGATAPFIGLFGTVLPYIFYMTGLTRPVEASKVPIVASVETVVAAVLGAVLFHEAVGPAKITGILLVFLSVAVINSGGSKASKDN